MRAILSKVVAGSMLAGAALMVFACGGNTAAPVNNTTEVNTTDEAVNVSDEMTTSTDAGANSGVVANDVAPVENAGNAM